MIKVAIIGCGKIADSHVEQIQRIAGCELVGVCDREEIMARQLAERFSIKRQFTDVETLLDKLSPDVVHITTPPQSHYQLARTCLERRCHVYVEKPFTLNTDQAVDLIEIAKRNCLKLTVGHDAQFTHAARRLREQVHQGFLGDSPVHMESIYGYELSDRYAQELLADPQHWVRKLPGRLLQNLISHGVARVAEYLSGEEVQVIAYGFVSAALRKRGEENIVDELRVILRDQRDTTAYFTFSSQMRPALHQFRIYGSANGLILDDDEQVVLKLRGARRKSYLAKFVPPVCHARQYLGNLGYNLRLFLRNDFHMKSGMYFLIESFYRSISENSPAPIPQREILLTSRIMEEIFTQVNGCASVGDGKTTGVSPRSETQDRPESSGGLHAAAHL